MDCTVIILVGGGAASRMAPLSNGRSKSVLPFLGRPLLHYLFRLLERERLTDVVLTSSGPRDDVRRAFGDGSSYGLNLRYGTPSGTVGTVSAVRDAIAVPGGSLGKTLLIIYGDSLLEADLNAFVDRHVVSGAAVTLLTHTARFEAFPAGGGSDTPQARTNFGVVEMQMGGIVERFVEKPTFDTLATFVKPVASAAVYAIQHEFLVGALTGTPIPQDFGFDCFPKWIHDGLRVSAVDIGLGFRFDIGTLQQYLGVQIAALRGLVPVKPDLPRICDGLWADSSAVLPAFNADLQQVVVGAHARIAAGARVTRSVIGDNAVVEAGAIIEDSVVLEGVRVGAMAVVRQSIIDRNVVIDASVEVPVGSVAGDSSRIGGSFIVDEHSIQQLMRFER